MSKRLVPPHLETWARSVVPRLLRPEKPPEPGRKRRALLVHVDGVSNATLDEAIAAGRMPFVAKMLSSGAYHRDRAFWGAPPSTPVFEASALYGVRHPDIPAYRWFDRAQGRFVQMNEPADARAVEEKLRRAGTSLLGDTGTAYLTLFQGAEDNRLAMAALTEPKLALRELKESLKALLASARHGPIRNLGRFAWEMGHALADGARAGLGQLDWRHEQELALVRVFVLGALGSIARARAMADMVRGAPVVYLVEAGFDEVSHRRGPRSKQALRELSRIDASIAHLHAISHALELPYDLYLFSDHGQTSTVPYEAIAGRTFGEALSIKAHPPPLPAAVATALRNGRTVPKKNGATPADVQIAEVGALAHIYLGRGDALEALGLLADHSELLARLCADERVGLFVVRRGEEAVAIRGSEVLTAADVTTAKLPAGYSARAVAELLHELPRMPNGGDIVVFGAATADGVVGFSWEAGTHGGLTTAETDSFVIWPKDGPVSLDALGHAVALHGRLSDVYRAR